MRKKESSQVRRPVHPKLKPIEIRPDGTIAPEEFTEEEQAFFQRWQPVTIVTRKDFEESARVGQMIGAVQKLCWYNARRVVQKLDDYKDASYVEGFACLNGGPAIEHSWVCRLDGTIIDPTLPRHGGAYFPGLEFVGRAGIEEFLSTPHGRACKKTPFLFAFGFAGRLSPGINKAWEESDAFLRKHYPEAFKTS